MITDYTEKMLKFIDNSPVGLFAIDNMARAFDAAGYTRLYEKDAWELKRGGDYYVIRDQSAIAAFRVPKRDSFTAMIMASHADSPMFRIKPDAQITVEDSYIKLNVEKYGGAILSTWFDRPLSVAGRVLVKCKDGTIESRLIDIDRDLLIIPSLAIHMESNKDEGKKINVQNEMLPLFAQLIGENADKPRKFTDLIAKAIDAEAEDIIDYDLYLYNRQKGCTFGADNEFIGSGRLDDLQCAFSSMEGLLSSERGDSLSMHCVFYNEEVGSSTKQGAGSTFLSDTLLRIYAALDMGGDEYLRALSESFMISADNAHSIHPNYTDKADPTNRPMMNKGPVIKYNANQKYATDAVSGAIFKQLCEKADVPYQTFVNRSDMPGGSTLGNISNTQVPMLTADIGLAQLSMHSAYETAGAYDADYLITVAREFFSSTITRVGDNSFRIDQ